jgi:hypothetical protein
LCHCNTCDFLFYNPHPDAEELEKLYNGYRNPDYQKQRQKHEKWYTREVNESLGHNRTEIDKRKENMSLFLKGRLDIAEIKNILDYGGDSGQFIMDEFKNSERYVYEISKVPLVPGVKLITDLDERETKKFDFIMCCHVLEHVTGPHEIIDQIIMFAQKKTKFYFELPVDNPLGNTNLITRIKITLSRLYPFFIMHEHINHFSIASLKKLLESHGMEVEHITSENKLLACYATMK